jgi:hypothetical protein
MRKLPQNNRISRQKRHLSTGYIQENHNSKETLLRPSSFLTQTVKKLYPNNKN